tara:strand:- start:80 stop:559 length:480 start_codon:yes stop_codon:yes gene_type:complete
MTIKKWIGRITTWGLADALLLTGVDYYQTNRDEIKRLNLEVNGARSENRQLKELFLSQVDFPNLPEPVVVEDPYDYCIISDDSSDRDKARAAGGARPKGLFDGSLDSIDSLVLSPENMVSSGKNNPSSRYQVMVVGVGYEDDSLQKDLGDTIDHFERVF